jgi:hypothetical protein
VGETGEQFPGKVLESTVTRVEGESQEALVEAVMTRQCSTR